MGFHQQRCVRAAAAGAAMGALAALAGCGGGGGGGDLSATGPSYVSWTGNANGEVVVDANNEEFRIDAASRQVADRTGTLASGLTVDANARILDAGTPVGQVQTVDGTGGSRIAAFRCSDGSAMDISFRVDKTYTYSCAGAGSGAGSGGPGSSGGSTGGTASGSASYATFTGSSNGTVVLDSDSERFQVDQGTRNVVDRSGVQLGDLLVDTSGNVVWRGSTIGAVTLANGSNGSQVAVFSCSNGAGMNLTVSVSQWTYSCGGGTASGGSSSGASSGSGSGSGGAPSRSFISWTGSANGESVVDASGDFFKFNSATRCLYSENRDIEYRNFCLGSQNTVVFQGSTYQVSRVISVAGTCITALTTSSGHYADIVTGGDQVDQISASSLRPEGC